MKITALMINSRGDKHPDWLNIATYSVEKQTSPVDEFIIIDNIGRKNTIGKCHNDAIKEALGDYIIFIDDDDWWSCDLVSVLKEYIKLKPDFDCYTTYMTAYDEETKLLSPLQRIWKGIWKKEYLLKHPFNEDLKTGVDREYIEEFVKSGNQYLVIPHYYGYYYRKHNDYSCAGKINFIKKPVDIYIVASQRNFIDPYVSRMKNDGMSVAVYSPPFDYNTAKSANVIFCEWAKNYAQAVASYKGDVKKILRIHAFEVFGEYIHQINFKAFDKIIFVAEHIKNYLEKRLCYKLDNAVIIPNGVDVNKFNFKNKKKNNKIAWSGYITRKKGTQLLIYLANNFKDYEFHVSGKFQEEDVCQYFNEKQPGNLFIHPWQYNLPEFFEDKTYILNTSLREGCPLSILEGMSAGLKPLIFDWIGASEIFGKEHTWSDNVSLKNLLEEDCNPKKYRDFVVKNFNFENTYKQIKEIING